MECSLRCDRDGRFVRAGFTLVELMVSVTILSLMMVLVFQMLDETQKTWARAKGMVGSFKEARAGFESMNRVVSQATLNTYLGYDRDTRTGIPRTFERKSELHFVCGPAKDLLGDSDGHFRVTHAIFFQAPLGFQTIASRRTSSNQGDRYGEMDSLLNGWGYYVEYASDKSERPPFLSQLTPPVAERWRYRLMEFRQPAEATTVYQHHLEEIPSPTENKIWAWFTNRKFGVDCPANMDPVGSAGEIRTARSVADNIVALIISPRLAENDLDADGAESTNVRFNFKKATDIAPEYLYDSREFQYASRSSSASAMPDEVRFSRHQIPPVLRITLIAIDEVDATRYAAQHDPTRPPDYAPKDTLFSRVEDYPKDLDFLSSTLDKVSIRHRVFTSNIRMREGNFSKTY